MGLVTMGLAGWGCRLMGWRSEFGGDAFWAERLGKCVAGLGGHGLWREMSARMDRLVG